MMRWYVGDVMTRDVVSVAPTAGYKEIADLMVRRSISAVPVVDAQRQVLGVVSEADLLAKLEYADRVPRHPLTARRMRSGQQKAAGDTAAELMTRPAVTVPATETVTGAARLMDAARVKRMPVVDDGGRLIGIVSRRDLVRMYTRPDAQLRASVAEGVLRSLWIDPAALHITVRAGIVTLSGRVDRRSLAGIVVAFTRAIPGVVDVVDQLSWEVDDGTDDNRYHPGFARS
ncbi:MAG: CBS domain-containing protein [Actinobacteria bacterium]|nr:MAG: CBS domain-containing protein [Actinomycetota bacterium]